MKVRWLSTSKGADAAQMSRWSKRNVFPSKLALGAIFAILGVLMLVGVKMPSSAPSKAPAPQPPVPIIEEPVSHVVIATKAEHPPEVVDNYILHLGAASRDIDDRHTQELIRTRLASAAKKRNLAYYGTARHPRGATITDGVERAAQPRAKPPVDTTNPKHPVGVQLCLLWNCRIVKFWLFGHFIDAAIKQVDCLLPRTKFTKFTK